MKNEVKIFKEILKKQQKQIIIFKKGENIKKSIK